MRIEKEIFGSYEDQDIEQYILTNDIDTQVKVMTYGATTTSIKIRINGELKDVVCGFDSFEAYFSELYLNNAPYFGGIIGRYASRIKDGKFDIDGVTYEQAINDGSNHLHGGIVGFDKKIWKAEPISHEDYVGVKMTVESPDGEEGYPGNVKVAVSFLLNNANELTLKYEGESDKKTPLSLTNHNYFNLSGFERDIRTMSAQINANQYLKPDTTNVPLGEKVSVNNDFSDLTSLKPLGAILDKTTTGFEHYYVFDNQKTVLKEVAKFLEKDLSLTVLSTEPGALFYTGFFTSDELSRASGEQYGKYRAFCFETSKFPNGPNIAEAADSVLNVGDKYQSTTVYKFST